MRTNFRQAFTLVELAIVLVIIGLLVGGVLAGQELIQQGKQKKVISQMNDHLTSIRAFQSKYNALPGDYNRATNRWGTIAGACQPGSVEGTGTQTCNGNGDGRVQYVSYENWRLWQHLSNAELTAGSYSGVYYTGCAYSNICFSPGRNAPEGVESNTMWNFFYVVGGATWISAGRGRHVLVYSADRDDVTNVLYQGYWHNAALTPQEQLSIDTKIDDGMPYRGRITDMTGGATYTPGCASSDTYSASATYAVANTEKRCLMFVEY